MNSMSVIPAYVIPYIVVFVVAFIAAYIGNLLSFSSRLLNALVTGIVFAAAFGGWVFATGDSTMEAFYPVLFGAVVIAIIDLIGNMLAFSNRLVNALVTAVLSSALVFGFVSWLG